MGNLTPRTPLEFLVQENNRLVTNLISVSGSGSASSSVTSSVASSATSVQLLAANANRVEAVITNDSTAILYIKLGTGATTSDYTISLSPNESLIVDKYNGILHGVWASVNGNARITETS
jgi:hypothetical protein